MKKILYAFIAILVLAGCEMMDNTPTKKVEALLHKYQVNDSEVVTDLDNVLFMDSDLNDDERKEYHNFMKKHYQDLTYKVKNEKIDGDTATVDVEITVRDYSNAVNTANQYRMDNPDVFDENNSFTAYRLDRLKEVSETSTYTLIFHLTKANGKWQVDPLTTDDESKINGLYGVNDITINIDQENSFSNEGVSDESNTENDMDSDDSEDSDAINSTQADEHRKE